MKKLLLILPLTLLASETNTTQENNTTIVKKEDSATLYLKNACNSCHGIYGEGIGSSPKIQGQRADVLLKRLKALQAGKPRTAFGGVMVSFAKSLDENQTIEMAKYLSELKPNENDERYDEEYDPHG
nr:c-type cytochrome [Campylobacterota bacterium]